MSLLLELLVLQPRGQSCRCRERRIYRAGYNGLCTVTPFSFTVFYQYRGQCFISWDTKSILYLCHDPDLGSHTSKIQVCVRGTNTSLGSRRLISCSSGGPGPGPWSRHSRGFRGTRLRNSVVLHFELGPTPRSFGSPLRVFWYSGPSHSSPLQKWRSKHSQPLGIPTGTWIGEEVEGLIETGQGTGSRLVATTDINVEVWVWEGLEVYEPIAYS